jgi:hypothetical protein
MNLRNLFFSVITLSLTACGPAVNTTKTTNDLSIYKTFAYLPNSNFEDLDRDTATITSEPLLLKVSIPTCSNWDTR